MSTIIRFFLLGGISATFFSELPADAQTIGSRLFQRNRCCPSSHLYHAHAVPILNCERVMANLAHGYPVKPYLDFHPYSSFSPCCENQSVSGQVSFVRVSCGACEYSYDETTNTYKIRKFCQPLTCFCPIQHLIQNAPIEDPTEDPIEDPIALDNDQDPPAETQDSNAEKTCMASELLAEGEFRIQFLYGGAVKGGIFFKAKNIGESTRDKPVKIKTRIEGVDWLIEISIFECRQDSAITRSNPSSKPFVEASIDYKKEPSEPFFRGLKFHEDPTANKNELSFDHYHMVITRLLD